MIPKAHAEHGALAAVAGHVIGLCIPGSATSALELGTPLHAVRLNGAARAPPATEDRT